jgi:hypothetical protein
LNKLHDIKAENMVKNHRKTMALYLCKFITTFVLGISAIGGVANAASATMSMSPDNGSYKTGSMLSVTLYEDSGSTAVATAQSDVQYPADLLEFQGVDSTAGVFSDIKPPPIIKNGIVSLSRGSVAGYTGKQIIGIVNFTVIAPGTAQLAFAQTSVLYEDAQITNIYTGGTGARYTITGAHIPISASSTTTSSDSVSYTPVGSSTSESKPANAIVDVKGSVLIAPATRTSQITQVDYYLNGKKVATRTKAPWGYIVDSKKLADGTYKLTITTTYTTGSPKTVNQMLKVHNTADLLPYTLGAGLVLLAGIGLFVWMMLRKRREDGAEGSSRDIASVAPIMPIQVIVPVEPILSNQPTPPVIAQPLPQPLADGPVVVPPATPPEK